MLLTNDTLSVNEGLSSPALVALCCPDCPLLPGEVRPCFLAAAGFGGVDGKCPHLVEEAENIACGYPDAGRE